MLHNHTCNHYLVHLSDMTLRRPGDAEEMQSLIKCKIHVHVFGGGGSRKSPTVVHSPINMRFCNL